MPQPQHEHHQEDGAPKEETAANPLSLRKRRTTPLRRSRRPMHADRTMADDVVMPGSRAERDRSSLQRRLEVLKRPVVALTPHESGETLGVGGE
jgi:hypothetical protein